MTFEKFTLEKRPDLSEEVERLSAGAWPTFLLHGDMTHWARLYDDFAGTRSCSANPGRPDRARAHDPFAWDGAPDDLPYRIWTALWRPTALE